MSLLYADTSAVARAYFPDEPEHEDLRTLLFDRGTPIVSSELLRVEMASVVEAAARVSRISSAAASLDGFDRDCSDTGPLSLLKLDASTVLPLAHRLVREHRLRTLDAMHLAVALTDASAFAGDEPLTFVTRDQAQADAAKALGFEVN